VYKIKIEKNKQIYEFCGQIPENKYTQKKFAEPVIVTIIIILQEQTNKK